MIEKVRGLVTLLVILAGCQSEPANTSCASVAERVLTLMASEPHAREMSGAFRARCEQDRWSADARACIAATPSADEPKHCRSKLTAAQGKQLDDALNAIEHGGWPASCTRYEALLANALRCEALPQQVRDSLRANFDRTKAEWQAKPDKRELAMICGSAIAGLRQATVDCPP